VVTGSCDVSGDDYDDDEKEEDDDDDDDVDRVMTV
jgi:hypothetical protein